MKHTVACAPPVLSMHVAVCCSVLQCVAVCCSALLSATECCSVLHCLNCISVHCQMLQYIAACSSVLQCDTYRVLQCVALSTENMRALPNVELCLFLHQKIHIFQEKETYVCQNRPTCAKRGVSVWCAVLQCVIACCSVLQWAPFIEKRPAFTKRNVSVCCTVLQCVMACCSVLQRAPFIEKRPAYANRNQRMCGCVDL